MDNLKQVETVKEALGLEVFVANTQGKLSDLLMQEFESAPNPPVCETVQRTYPKIETQTRFNWALAFVPIGIAFMLMIMNGFFFFLFLPSLAWPVVYYFAFFRKQKKQEIEMIRNSEEYRAKCAELDREFDAQQEVFNQEYDAEMFVYETEVIPEYQKALDEWNSQHNKVVSETREELTNAQNKLRMLYETSKLIPLQYRQISILRYLYDLMSTSDYDIKQAIEVYDRNEQRKLDEERLYEQQQANRLANEQNNLLYEQNEIADRARREANIASVVSAVQRHNISKKLGK